MSCSEFTCAKGSTWCSYRTRRAIEDHERERLDERLAAERQRDMIAATRAAERERCAKALEAERDRVMNEECITLGESCVYDVCALVIRQLDAGEGQN